MQEIIGQMKQTPTNGNKGWSSSKEVDAVCMVEL